MSCLVVGPDGFDGRRSVIVFFGSGYDGKAVCSIQNSSLVAGGVFDVPRTGRCSRLVGDFRLGDAQIASAKDGFEGDGSLHFAGQGRGIELVGITNAFVWDEFQICSAEGMAFTGVEIGEGHPVTTADFGIELMDFADKSIGRKPFGHGIGIQKSAIDPLRRGAEHPVKLNGVGVGFAVSLL
jgi:hypothetical protein